MLLDSSSLNSIYVSLSSVVEIQILNTFSFPWFQPQKKGIWKRYWSMNRSMKRLTKGHTIAETIELKAFDLGTFLAIYFPVARSVEAVEIALDAKNRHKRFFPVSSADFIFSKRILNDKSRETVQRKLLKWRLQRNAKAFNRVRVRSHTSTPHGKRPRINTVRSHWQAELPRFPCTTGVWAKMLVSMYVTTLQ